MEELELILHPMVEDGKEAVGSMGDDTPLAVLSQRYRGLHHFFRQNFSQVTNPPIDSLREQYQMSLKTRLGNLGNILDEDSSQTRLLQLESPILSNAEFAAMRAYMGKDAVEIDCTFPTAGGEHALRDAIRRIQREAEDAIRGGCVHVILTDERHGRHARGDPDDPRGRRRAHASRAPAAAHLHLAQRPLGGVPGRALCRRADRRRRHHGQRLSRRGEHRRPPSPRPVRRG